MHEILHPAELSAFYRFAVEHSDVWAAMEKQRLEHSRLGSGTLERFIPSVDPKSESVIEVRFDAPVDSDADAKLKRLAARVVFDNNLLESLAVPSSLMDRFRTFTIQENWKKDWRRFEKVLEEHRIECLYHFTDIKNLDSIREHGGLYSWWRCKGRGIQIPVPGSDMTSRERDRAKGLQDYVRLSFGPHNPMMYAAREEGRIKVPRILRVDASVIYLESTLFSDINANYREARAGGDFDAFDRIHFDAATHRRRPGEVEKRFRQAEVLVQSHVPLDLIENL